MNALAATTPLTHAPAECVSSYPNRRETSSNRFATGVQRVPVAPSGSDFRPLTALVNEAPVEMVHLVGLSNEFGGTLAADGWAMVPYGEHGNSRGQQIFGREQAEQMVGYFKNGWNQLKRAFRGMPIVKGHPDFADELRKELGRTTGTAARHRLQSQINELDRRYPDKTVYGTIADMEAREHGLALKPVLTEAGLALVNAGLSSFSPHWLGTDVPGRPGAKAPVYMVSIGLTDRPNIAGTSLINDAPLSVSPVNEPNPPTKDTTMPTWLLELLGLAADATEEQVKAKLQELLDKKDATEATAKVAEAETALANERAAIQGTRAQLTTAQLDLKRAQTALANERTERATALVNDAVTGGKITEAQKPVWIARLETNFKAEATALANEQAVKTSGVTGSLGQRKGGMPAKEQFTALVNEKIATGMPRDDAWQSVKRTEQGKALLAEMAAPAKADAS